MNVIISWKNTIHSWDWLFFSIRHVFECTSRKDLIFEKWKTYTLRAKHSTTFHWMNGLYKYILKIQEKYVPNYEPKILDCFFQYFRHNGFKRSLVTTCWRPRLFNGAGWKWCMGRSCGSCYRYNFTKYFWCKLAIQKIRFEFSLEKRCENLSFVSSSNLNVMSKNEKKLHDSTILFMQFKEER